ncbi:MAG: hypothetical protein Q4A11_01570 [Brachymonas sp.]|nr:hypothetical protein [Brachymonas sp.]
MQTQQNQRSAPSNRARPTGAWACGRAAVWVLAGALGAGSLLGCQPAGGSGGAQPAASLAVSAAAAQTASAPEAPASAPAAGASQAAAMPLRGIYTWGSEVETLSPCNSNKTYWLEGDEKLLAPLQDLAIRKADAANEAYQPIYVEVLVSDAGRATDGFAVDYDGLMQLQAVQAASAQVPADCKLLDWPEMPVATDAADTSRDASRQSSPVLIRPPSAPLAQ